MARWHATARYLAESLPDFSFLVVPLTFEQVPQAVEKHHIDFLIINSSYYVTLESSHGVSRIATLKNRINGISQNVFGSVIFTVSERNDLNVLQDLRGKDFLAVDANSLGGWQMAWREFHNEKIDPAEDFRSLTYAGTHDEVVYGVLAGRADAGSVRTDTLERMSSEGKIDLQRIKIIHKQTVAGFPYLLSTKLYPEWPFAKLKHTSETLASRVAVALLDMSYENPAAREANIAGWTIPLDYQAVHELMQELRIGLYARHLGPVTWADIYMEHRNSIFLTILLVIAVVAVALFVSGVNAKLRSSREQLKEQLERLKTTEAFLAASEQNYREIFNAANDAFFIHDLASGAILDVNKTMCDLFGYDRDEIANLEVADLSLNHPPYSTKEATAWIDKCVHVGPQTFEWRAKKKNGELFWAEVTLQRATLGGEERILAVVHDIDRRKEAEGELEKYQHDLVELVEERTFALRQANLELQRQESCLAEAQRIAHLGSWDWQIPNNEIWWSEEVYRIFGISPRDFNACYESFLAALHPDDLARVKEAVTRSLRNKERYDIEHRILRPNGEVRFVHEWAEVVQGDGGRSTRMVGTVLDITERKLAEKAKKELENQLIQAQKMEALGTMAGGIAHDFNNILSAILGYTELSRLEIDNRQVLQQHLDSIYSAAIRTRDLIAQILTFSRRSKVVVQPLCLAPIIREVMKLLQATTPATIELRSSIESEEAKIMADPTRIHQVLMNLCMNAIHAIGEEIGFIDIRLSEAELASDCGLSGLGPGRYLKLSVTDSGPGISQNIQNNIFEPFFTTKEKGVGTGMGLAVVHGIVTTFGGAIFLTSEEGRGATFDLYFPRLQDDELDFSCDAEKDRPIPKGQERVLLVDDEQQIVEMTEQLLKSFGYKVTSTSDSFRYYGCQLSKK